MPPLRNQQKDYNRFGIPLQPTTPIGLGVLIAQDEDGHYELVAVASTVTEAREHATR